MVLLMKKHLVNISTIMISLLFSVFIVEIGLQLFDYGEEIAPTSNQYNFFQYDKTLGWKNKPGASGTFARRDFSTSIKINKFGMRDKDVPNNNLFGKYRVAILGDSFSWGHGVELSERYDVVAKEYLKNSDVEFLNFAVTGYGPVQYLLQLDEVLKFKPTLVVLGFCLQNDYVDNAIWRRYGYYGPFGALKGNSVEIEGYPIPNVKKFGFLSDDEMSFKILSKLKLYSLVKKAIAKNNSKVIEKEQDGLVGYTYDSVYNPEDPLHSKALIVNDYFISEIKRRLDNNNIKLVILAVPTKKEYAPMRADFNPTVARSNLTQTAGRFCIELIDPTEQMSLKDFFEHDGHWNANGHKKVARVLSDYLVTKRDRSP